MAQVHGQESHGIDRFGTNLMAILLANGYEPCVHRELREPTEVFRTPNQQIGEMDAERRRVP